MSTADSSNVALFGSLAADWWNPHGSSRLLHRINPVRLSYVREAAIRHFGGGARARRPLAGLAALDVGCGAGLLSEPLARMGADVVGIDAAPENIDAARAHAQDQGLSIDYRAMDIADLADSVPASMDLITALEVVEHVTDLDHFLGSLGRLLKPGGLLVFSTPNRTAASFAVLIAGAEYITRLIPRGGHSWRQFQTPPELTAKLATAGLVVRETRGLSWTPARGFVLSDDVSVNYIGVATPSA
ncbi:bifunctional 2-polyprenyl-6-hydroxyphenol methylase/3-demethylubiquinol 3-O-methyltransferase UbiG [Sandaracinobacteroides saxicola]|uniref:Ubiquinone biosynthesis O-methyltransferase n=1 Tax=Sandaracinobacteroides saxicola TaxID=2759707 RepID=A0A7G5ILU4_9SPHN|nr:bifunctional 2-polyprenyl-6-hydroxyphenol methylase/3-demethylubiquinol 3-O-methyltransferase UbiG [Sandaracinobacteroides saxicola]QMW24336.1 bifunctional 2-polyprenyl-6-hydroxyphenol methylase/3-demethylubiquinol 3-O-methyltransferase UbiG [Sandaracinobacteroides saxicola]